MGVGRGGGEDLVVVDVGPVVAGTGGGQAEALDGEGQVLVVRVVDEEAVVDGLLQTLCLVALGHERAVRAGGGALLHAGGLAQQLVVSLDVVDDDAPLAVHVDGAQWLDVLGLGGAQVGLLHDILQAVNGVLGVGEHILVQLLHGVIIVLDGLLNLVGGVLGVLQAVSVRLVRQELGALGRAAVWLLVGRHWVVRGMRRRGTIWGGVVRGIRRWRVGRGLMAVHGGVPVRGRGRGVGGRGVVGWWWWRWGSMRVWCPVRKRMRTQIGLSTGVGASVSVSLGFGIAGGEGQHSRENLQWQKSDVSTPHQRKEIITIMKERSSITDFVTAIEASPITRAISSDHD